MARGFSRESKVKNHVLAYALRNGLPCARIFTGLVRTDKGHFIKGADAGTFDIVIQRPDGLTIWADTKARGGKLSPVQLVFKARVEMNNGIAIPVLELDDLANLIEPYLLEHNRRLI